MTDKTQKPSETLKPLGAQHLGRLSQDSEASLSPEEIAELGQAARTALSDPMWQDAFQATLSQIVASWLQSQPEDKKLREHLWMRAQNLVSLEDQLVANINELQGQKLTENEEAEQDLNRFLDEQGFNLGDIPGYDENLN